MSVPEPALPAPDSHRLEFQRWTVQGQERARQRDEWILGQLEQGLLQKEVAAKLGISEQRVSMLVTRARRRIDPSYSPAKRRAARRAAKTLRRKKHLARQPRAALAGTA